MKYFVMYFSTVCKVFADASVATVIVVLEKQSNQLTRERNEIQVIRQQSYDMGIQESAANRLDQIAFSDTPLHAFRLDLDNQTRAIIEKIDSNSTRLGDICYLITGAVLHDPRSGASKDRLIHKNYAPGLKPYIEAKEIARYSPPISNRFLEYRADEMHRPKFPELFENEKLLIARIATEVKATLDTSHLYTDHTIDLAVRLDNLAHLKLRDASMELETEKVMSVNFCKKGRRALAF